MSQVSTLLRRSQKSGRPELYTDYGQHQAMLNTPAKRWGVGVLVVLGFLSPFMFEDDVLLTLAIGCVFAIGAIGLNLVTGYAGQVSLGHAFFVGVGAYTAAILGGPAGGRTVGYELDMLIWLPAAGIAAALIGALIGPIATRLRGLYLAIVTLGLVFLGLHIFREARTITGGYGTGRSAAIPQVLGFRFDQAGEVFGVMLSRQQKLAFLMLFMLIVMAVVARNLTRSSVGRAFAAVRDRDIAASIIGVNLTKYKVLAFTISSFYAGIAGGLLYTITGFVEPSGFDLLLSVQFIAMILIGGVATVSGSIMGGFFIAVLPRVTRELGPAVPFIGGGGLLTVFQLEQILYGLLIVGFLLLEPRGLFGIWFRFRNYWKGWPFSY
jgi:branched-chain amino acid transport system permease protein